MSFISPANFLDVGGGATPEKIVKALRKKIDIASQIMGEKLEEWI